MNDKTSEYPTEYLVTRLKGKTNQFPSDWSFIRNHSAPLSVLQTYPVQEYIDLYQEAGPYYFVNSQYRWILTQMNCSLHKVFKPFFFYLQVEEIIILLRLRLHGDYENKLRSWIQFSLLEDGLCRALIQSTDFSSTLKLIATFLKNQSSQFNNFPETAKGINWQTTEKQLIKNCFSFILSCASHKSVQHFIKYLIDKTNLIALSKTLVWQMVPPEPINGGNIPTTAMVKISTRKQSSHIKQFYPHFNFDLSSTKELEQMLLQHITSSLRKKKIPGSSVDYILFYLWNLHITTRNISLLLTETRSEEYIH